MIVKQINFRITCNAQIIKFSIDLRCMFKICYQTVNWVYLTFKLSLLSKIFYAQLDVYFDTKSVAYSVSSRETHVSLLWSVFPKPLGKAKADKKRMGATQGGRRSLWIIIILLYRHVLLCAFSKEACQGNYSVYKISFADIVSNRPNLKNGLPNRRLTAEILLN